MLLLKCLQIAIILIMNKKLLKPYKEKAEQIGCSPAYLMQIANGHRKPSPEFARELNKLFGIPLWELRPDVYPREMFNSNSQT